MEWKEIPGYEGQYSISDEGDIRSNYRWYINPKTLTRHKKDRELIMTPNVGSAGYARIRLSDRILHPYHRLVALVWVDNPENKPFVNHKDGNKLNNHPSNLEWVTVQENNQHAYDTGLNSGLLREKKLAHTWSFTSPSGVITEIFNLCKFCRENDLAKSSMIAVHRGKQHQHKGWKNVRSK